MFDVEYFLGEDSYDCILNVCNFLIGITYVKCHETPARA